MEVKRWELMPHVYLTYLPARRFKTGVLSAQFITPLAKETASYNALLPAVLHRGTMRCPDMEQLAAAMDRLYGAQISPTIASGGRRSALASWPALSTTGSSPGMNRCWSLRRSCWGSCCWTL